MYTVRDVGDIALNGGVGGIGNGGENLDTESEWLVALRSESQHSQGWEICRTGEDREGRAVSALLATGSVVALLSALAVAGRWCLRHFSTRGIEQRLEGLHGQVVSWQAAHDHQVAGIDRRLRDVEASAARAENEARIVSVQLTNLSALLLGRMEEVEHRLLSRRHGSPGRPRSVVPAPGLVAGAGR